MVFYMFLHAALVVRPCTYCRAAELVWNDAYIENQSRICIAYLVIQQTAVYLSRHLLLQATK
jgi:hypothetical protein